MCVSVFINKQFHFITVRPQSVVILNKPRPMVANQHYTIQCEVIGSRPRATVLWTRDNREFRRGTVSFFFIFCFAIKYNFLFINSPGELTHKHYSRFYYFHQWFLSFVLNHSHSAEIYFQSTLDA